VAPRLTSAPVPPPLVKSASRPPGVLKLPATRAAQAHGAVSAATWADSVQWNVVTVAGALLCSGAVALGATYGVRHGALCLIGAGCGIALRHAAFGFTAAYRALVTTGDGRGFRAQLFMLAVATVLFAPGARCRSRAGGRGGRRTRSRQRLRPHRRLHLRHRHAARRWLRLRDAVPSRVRPGAVRRHAGGVPRRLGDRHLPHVVLVVPAVTRRGVAGARAGLDSRRRPSTGRTSGSSRWRACPAIPFAPPARNPPRRSHSGSGSCAAPGLSPPAPSPSPS
jgi:hypothetical protein